MTICQRKAQEIIFKSSQNQFSDGERKISQGTRLLEQWTIYVVLVQYFSELKGVLSILLDPLPPLEMLVNLPVAAEWKEVGLHLGVPDAQLDIIQADNAQYPHHTQCCLRDMFGWCLKNCSGATYEKLVHSLVIVGKHSLAQDLCMKEGRCCLFVCLCMR